MHHLRSWHDFALFGLNMPTDPDVCFARFCTPGVIGGVVILPSMSHLVKHHHHHHGIELCCWVRFRLELPATNVWRFQPCASVADHRQAPLWLCEWTTCSSIKGEVALSAHLQARWIVEDQLAFVWPRYAFCFALPCVLIHLTWLVAWLSCLPCRIWCNIIIIINWRIVSEEIEGMTQDCSRVVNWRRKYLGSIFGRLECRARTQSSATFKPTGIVKRTPSLHHHAAHLREKPSDVHHSVLCDFGPFHR
jgi:hypothetical protein